MSTQNYSTVPSRNLIEAEMKFLKHAEPIMVLGSFGMMKEHPKRKTDTVVFRRTKPYNADSNEVPNIDPATLITSEGATPNSNTISFTDVTVTLKQFAVLFKFSSKTDLMYEDNVPDEMAIQTGETLGECAELVCYGQLKAGSQVSYTNGTTRAGLNTSIEIADLRLSARTLESNRAKKITSKIKSGPNYGTTAVEPGYVVFCHTDMVADMRDLPHFVPCEEYGGAYKKVHEREIGAVEDFRIVPSPLFKPFLGAGSATLNGMVSTGGSNADVYPVIVIARDCLGHVSLKGKGYTSISPTIIPASQKNHANPSGMFGYVGADFWYNAVRLNENWMVRIESCATDLDG